MLDGGNGHILPMISSAIYPELLSRHFLEHFQDSIIHHKQGFRVGVILHGNSRYLIHKRI